ncbi:LutC/YkgG family protein [Pedobacter arcticus]|uniref:LutC/YkgG family protein n=1 Tax=Pedobacter arcticus TaxID=752140 RepID=UPI0002D914A4|nr:LUD domain-containing protein [Pedobacter arcticus]
MTSREKILNAVKDSQPDLLPLPDLSLFYPNNDSVEENLKNFISIAERIGAKVYQVQNHSEIMTHLKEDLDLEGKRIVSAELDAIVDEYTGTDNHDLADVELMILPVHFGVAENGACWLDDELYQERLLPFIPQHLAFIIKKENIVATMHQAYELIADKSYGFGAFIAGPSKTADIEQSLVLGAHGPRSLRVFVV